jgi:hypothetical protein
LAKLRLAMAGSQALGATGHVAEGLMPSYVPAARIDSFILCRLIYQTADLL